jgi:hypothetical protein
MPAPLAEIKFDGSEHPAILPLSEEALPGAELPVNQLKLKGELFYVPKP